MSLNAETRHSTNARNGAAAHAQAKQTTSPRVGVFWPETTEKGNPRQRSQLNIRAFLDLRGVKLSMNAFSMRCYAEIDGAELSLDDDLLRKLRLEADALGLASPREFFEDVVIETAHANSYHPPRDYLAGLKWDGKPRLDRWLSTYLGAEDTPLHRAWGKAHLAAAVRRLRRPGAKHDAMLVLEGAQGAGKSTAVHILGGPWYSDSLTIGEGPKEVIEQTSGCWLIEISELNGIKGRGIEQVKAMISRQSDRARLAWGRHAVDRPRQFVLFGTVNDAQYLGDSTGNRRFWPVKVGRVDLQALRRDRDQIWAEAAAYEAANVCVDLDPALYAEAAKAQEQRVLSEPWRDILECALANVSGTIATETIFRRLGIEPKFQDGNVGARVARIMTALGFEKTKRRRLAKLTYCYTNEKTAQTHWVETL